MGFGRSCFISVFPYIGSLGAFFLTLIVVLGSIRSNVLTNVYFLRVDISNLTASSALEMLSGTTVDSSLESAINTIINEETPLPDFYTTALWNYCYGNVSSNSSRTLSKLESLVNLDGKYHVTYCSDPKAMYWFNATQVLLETEGAGSNSSNTTVISETVSDVLTTAIETASNLDDVRKYMGTIEGVSKASFVIYIISLVFLFLTLVVGPFSCSSRGVNCCSTILSLISFALVLVATGLVTGMYTILRNLINNNLGQYGIEASLSSTMLGIAWGGVGAALWATFWWFFSICIGSTHKKHEPEKEPFIPYNNYPPQHPY